MKNFKTLAALLCVTLAVPMASPHTLVSPNGKLKVEINLDSGGDLCYSVTHEATPVLAQSVLGMRLGDGLTLAQNVKKSPRATTGTGEGCNTMTLNFGRYSVEWRVYDDGLAYRFVTRFSKPVTVLGETVQFTLPSDCKVWAAPVNTRVKEETADLRLQTWTSFENTYEHTELSKLSAAHLLLSPMLVDLNDGKRLLLSDYNVRDYPGIFLLPAAGNVVQGYFAPCPKEQHQGGHNNLQMVVDSWYGHIALCEGSRAYPWRMMLVSSGDAQLITSATPRLLADKPAAGIDYSWVRPGKVAWDWWNDWNLRGVNFRAGINNETYKYYIDFAAKNKIEYVILDEGWAVNKQADLMQVVPEINLEELCAYAAQRGVGLVLWAGYKAFVKDMEGICAHYAKMGIKGFKIDFMDRNDQEIMRFVEDAARICAKHKLFCDFHGTPPLNGLTYTHPNILNCEAVAGLEQVKWSKLKDFDEVTHETILPFIRQVVAPMDYTQGAMRNAVRRNYYPSNSQPMSQGTRVRQMALYMIFDSPLCMLCDAPTSYEDNQECTDFISQVPVVWDEVRVLNAAVGGVVVEARRKGDTWWLGGINGWKAEDVVLDLSFIEGRKMTLFTDGVNAHRIGEDYRRTEVTVPASLQVHMAPGGGFAARVQ